MLITGIEGVGPIQKNTAAGRAGATGAQQAARRRGRYDHYTLSQTAVREESGSFRELAARLSQQVRTTNTTGKIQELRQEVRAGSYRIDPRETAARMLLMEEDA